MEHAKSQDTVKKFSSSNCVVHEYSMKNLGMGVAIAEITLRYPDHGYAINHKCGEMGYVLKGSGKLVTETQEVYLFEGDAVYLPSSEKYYWEGVFTVLLTTAPAWDPTQHEILSLSQV